MPGKRHKDIISLLKILFLLTSSFLNHQKVYSSSALQTYEKTFSAMNTVMGDQNLRNQSRNVSLQAGEKPPHVVRFFNEQDKFDAMADWQNVQDEIEQRLEVINATTDLITL